ncbi:DUF6894 family protein [Devosia submarina]|uniref:DUF6894 family protein n=1 Tax=Devosia submarina TaxID=1173082 RepID=UPI000D38211A|nr:hypothetical protein [Devosia submarina]
MPLYFFDIDDGAETVHDDEEPEFPDDQAARDESTRALLDWAKDYLPGGAPQRNITMWVRNSEGGAVLQLVLTFAVQPLRLD